MTALNYIIEDLRLRAEKAEAEAENLRAELGQRVAEAENRLDSERARADNYLGAFRREQERADRYLAAMQALIDGYRTNPEYLAAVAAIRAIVEEARRG